MKSLSKKQANILASMKQELDELKAECIEILQGDFFPLKVVIKSFMTSLTGADTEEKYNNGCAWLDEKIFHMNYIEAPEEKNGYAFKYDMDTAGTYCGMYTTEGYKGEPTKKEYYKEKLLDKFKKLLSLIYYEWEDLPIDYRPKAPTPYSACDLAEAYWLAEEEDEDKQGV